MERLVTKMNKKLDEEFRGNKVARKWLDAAVEFLKLQNRKLSDDNLYKKVKNQFIRATLGQCSFGVIEENILEGNTSRTWEIEYLVLEIVEIIEHLFDSVTLILSDGSKNLKVIYSKAQQSSNANRFEESAKILLKGPLKIEDNTVLIFDHNITKVVPLDQPLVQPNDIPRPSNIDDDLQFPSTQEMLDEIIRMEIVSDEDIANNNPPKRKTITSTEVHVPVKKPKKDDVIIDRILDELISKGVINNSFVADYLSSDDDDFINECMSIKQKDYSGMLDVLNELPELKGKHRFEEKFKEIENVAERVMKDKSSNNADHFEDTLLSYNTETIDYLRQVAETYGVNGRTIGFTGFVITNMDKLRSFMNSESEVVEDVSKTPIDVSERIRYFDDISKMPDSLEITKDLLNVCLIKGCLKFKIGVAKISLKELIDIFGFKSNRYMKNHTHDKYKELDGFALLAAGPKEYMLMLEPKYIKVGRDIAIALNADNDVGGKKNFGCNAEDGAELAVLYAVEIKESVGTQQNLLLDQSFPIKSNTLLHVFDMAVLEKDEMQSFKSCSSCLDVIFNNDWNFNNHVRKHDSKPSGIVNLNVQDYTYSLNKMELIKMYLDEYKDRHKIEKLRQYVEQLHFLQYTILLCVLYHTYLGILHVHGSIGEVQTSKIKNKHIVYNAQLKSYSYHQAGKGCNSHCIKDDAFINKLKEIINEISKMK